MALATYSDLQASVASWLAREGDSTISGMIPDAIALVEAKLNRSLRVSAMEAAATLTYSGGSYALPSDFLAWREVKTGSYGPLSFVTPDWASDTYPTGTGGGAPQFFTIKGSSLYVYPATTENLTLSYYQKIPALSDSNPTNWLLTNHPDVYLWLTLSEVNGFTQDVEAELKWNQRGMKSVEEVISQDVAKRYSRVSARVKGPTP